jgi:hypothetical protein
MTRIEAGGDLNAAAFVERDQSLEDRHGEMGYRKAYLA